MAIKGDLAVMFAVRESMRRSQARTPSIPSLFFVFDKPVWRDERIEPQHATERFGNRISRGEADDFYSTAGET